MTCAQLPLFAVLPEPTRRCPVCGDDLWLDGPPLSLDLRSVLCSACAWRGQVPAPEPGDAPHRTRSRSRSRSRAHP